MIARVFAEVIHLQTKRRGLPLAIVQDGAPELWNLVGNACKERGLRPAAEVIDRFHLDERLAAIVDIVANCDASVVALRRRWQQVLDRSDHGIDQIIAATVGFYTGRDVRQIGKLKKLNGFVVQTR